MYIWRKRVRSDWLRLRSEDLNERFGRALAIVERPGKRQILLEVLCPTTEQAHAVIREFGGSLEKLPRHWLTRFAKQSRTKPLRVGSRLVIQEKPAPRDGFPRVLIIPAEAAFGTGNHATTAMCLRLLERITRRLPPGWAMLDAGTGSGILALAGVRFGARKVLAIDNDPLACSTAKRNAGRNRIRGLEFVTADVLRHGVAGRFNIISANLFSELLIKALPQWSSAVEKNGWLIVSGVLRTQERDVTRALRKNSFNAVEIRRRGKWIALLCSKRKSVDAGEA